MNYWDGHSTFSRYDYVGLSGGGWTGTVLSALDRRVITHTLVAGSMPGIRFVSSQGDDEQYTSALYAVAGYLDMYLMAAYGVNHRQVQILNVADDCCFGPRQWDGTDASHYNMNWWQFLAFYSANLASGAASASILPWRYTLYEDSVAAQHQISPWALGIVLNVLANGTGGAHR